MEEPSFKEKKYDRQIRLWGSGGQKALETSKICLLNATGVGTETLKNLVLPGIGSFVIIDGNVVTEADLGNNFFLTPENLNQPRGEWATKWLLELNPDVKGSSLNEDPTQLIEKEPNYFSANGITLVIATQLLGSTVLKLALALEEQGIPLIVARSYGLMGFLRIQSPDYAVIETFPDQQVEDYHILSPFPELEDFVNNLGDPDFIEDSLLHAHIPWVCLAIHYIKKWKAQTGWNGTELSYAQRKEILALVSAGKRKEDEENFNEAKLASAKLNPPAVPAHLLDLMGSKEADLEGDTTDPFWFCLNALRQFYAKNHRLPINGKLADMTSTTQWFIQLQNVYAAKAQQDVEEMTKYITESIQKLTASGKKVVDVPADYISLFCKNVWHVKYMRYRPVRVTMDPKSCLSATIAKALEVDESNMAWYLLMRAGDKFHAATGRFPGENGLHEEDGALLSKTLKSMCSEMGITQQVDAEYVQEWVRYGAGELHNISAMLGGLASQEAIKLVTHQRVPLNNTLLFNGIKCTMTTFEL